MFGIGKSIFRRLLFGHMFTMLLGLCVVGFLLSLLTKGYIVDSQKEELLRKAKRVNLTVQTVTVPDDRVKEQLLFFDQTFDARIWLFDRNGKIAATSSKDEVYVGKSVDPSVVRKVLSGEEALLNEPRFEGLKEPMLSVVVPWGKDNEVYGGIVLHASVAGMNETITLMRETILWVTLVGVLLSAVTASYLSWSISRPLRRIDKLALRIGHGDYGERIEIASNDEIGELAATINQMADKLQRTDEDKRKQEQIRQDFLANVSHELRTPLTAMQGFLEALQDDLIDDAAKPKYYDIIYKETLHMNRLVDDIADLIKLENDEIALSRSPVDVRQLFAHIAAMFGPEAAERNTTIEMRTEEGLPDAYADRDRFEQIMKNLVKNAVKFTESGKILLNARAESELLMIQVVDTGIGISPDDQEMIWERFFKVDRGRSKKSSGTGLGLAIVRELVELHGGTITVRSEVGQGTVFEFRLPAAQNAIHEGGRQHVKAI
ncbi:histidine kinase [Paenibacillus elgii]|uniref:histidine kinase n=2 Tax=Paenibacillus elgii TaxID=189691 RepID=A0A161U5Z2_9BACL|nr:ATP-binding protein [Paenibacillus elgii]KZE80876.1 histidine kinase [Paenibacillus elgii]